MTNLKQILHLQTEFMYSFSKLVFSRIEFYENILLIYLNIFQLNNFD